MIPLLLAALLYFWTAFDYFVDERYAMGMAFIAYAIANIGFAFDIAMNR